MLKVAVLVSGGGTNLQALFDAQDSGIIKSAEISLVIADRKGCHALERAEKRGVRTLCLSRKKMGPEAFEEKLIGEIHSEGCSIIVLAGFLSILSPHFISEFRDRILNIHPSLIPSFCGDGFTVDAASGTDIVVKFFDGREESLLRSPFRGTQDILPAIYGTQDSVVCLVSYMVPEDLIRLSERKNRAIYRLIRVDLSSFDETVLFEAEASMENKWAFLDEARTFFLDEKNIYFILPQEVRQVDRRTHTVTALEIPTNKNVAFDGKKIFYLNEASCLSSYDPATGSTEIWEDVAAGDFVLGPGGVSYTDLRKGGKRCFRLLDEPEP